MTKLKELLEVLHENVELSSAEELKWACELIIEVQDFRPGHRDCIRAAYVAGPLWDGDVPDKTARDYLVERGYMAKVVVKGEQGYNACTYKGSWAYNLLEVGG